MGAATTVIVRSSEYEPVAERVPSRAIVPEGELVNMFALGVVRDLAHRGRVCDRATMRQESWNILTVGVDFSLKRGLD